MRALVEALVKRFCWMVIAGSLMLNSGAQAQKAPLLPEKDVAALTNELSGETAKRNLEGIARFHRQRGSKGFHAAAELVDERLRAYGLSDVAILQFSSRRQDFLWHAALTVCVGCRVGELIDLGSGGPAPCDKEKTENGKMVFNTDCGPAHAHKIASYEAEPVTLAEDSETADTVAELTDVEKEQMRAITPKKM